MTGFTHFDARGNAIMVDVSGKKESARTAAAAGRITMSSACYEAVRGGTAQKGDVLGVARVAGIQAAKRTDSLIPLCHRLPLAQVLIDFSFDDENTAVIARCVAKTTASTGVEMEALTGVSVALLTVYDMCKAMDKAMEIGGIYLAEKTGGKSGGYRSAKEPGK